MDLDCDYTYRFDEKAGSFYDDCNVADRDRQNAEVSRYGVDSMYPQDCGAQAARLAACHPNLHISGANKVTSCNIGADSCMRYGTRNTNPRERQQLNARVYHAVPDMSRGVYAPDKESGLYHGAMSPVCKRQENAFPETFAPLPIEHVNTVPSFRSSDTRAWFREMSTCRDRVAQACLNR